MNSKELPQYQSHKKVHALRINAIEIREDNSAVIATVEEHFSPVYTRPGWAERFAGTEEDPGVYVIYEDGFTSWSPTKAFDEGYTRIEPAQRTAGDAIRGGAASLEKMQAHRAAR